MKLITHIQKCDWGTLYQIMDSKGRATARAYREDNNPQNIYLSFLSVDEKVRRKGYGKNLQELREQIGRGLGCKYSKLWVKKGSWMVKWYKRRGYKYHSPYKEEKAIWLRKKL